MGVKAQPSSLAPFESRKQLPIVFQWVTFHAGAVVLCAVRCAAVQSRPQNSDTIAAMLIEAPQREYRTWIFDSRRWRHYQPRPDDIVIATYPKCGTTWMQRIVGLLIFQTPEPMPIMQISAWIDRRFPQPIEAVVAQIEAQKHRRFLKSHLPLDGLPFYDDVKYIHVVRDGRDACMSFHNHGRGLTDQMLDGLNKSGMEDDAVGRPYPGIPVDPSQFFHRWITKGEVPGQEQTECVAGPLQ